MKPLHIKKQESADVSAEDDTPSGLTFSTSPLAAGSPLTSLEPSRPPVMKGPGLSPDQRQDTHDLPTSAICEPSALLSAAAPATDKVKFTSELDNAATEAYLEYLTRPHTSWVSASRHMSHRREVIEEHRGSVYARSLARMRRASFASTVQSEGSCLDVLETSMNTSVASAPAGFPRTAPNGSKTSTGTLRKGRLGVVRPSPPSSEAMEPLSIVTRSSSVARSSHESNATSRSSTGTMQRSLSIKGRLSRGAALAGPVRPRNTSSSTKASAALDKGGLTVGGTQLQVGSTHLFVVNGHGSAVTSRSAERLGGNILHSVAPQEGGKSVSDSKRTMDLRAVVGPPHPKQRRM
ncbi:hypothetical protein JKF63_04905 [Porcisia hertigi]|uniref:Uncharacterized protein n=1 Tax=Porcisia hertigi TaxID=2761500 RepID=A0A836IMY2_9TRYP|nr:hypothetical protein JKF63_04905 [Porcisia hertigi]